MESYLVTGGAGSIGSDIVKALLELGKPVRVLGNCSTDSLLNLEEVIQQIEFVKGDVRDISVVREAVEGMDYVIHQAGVSSVDLSLDDPVATNEINVTGTLNVLTAAKDARAKRFVFASSASVYGNSRNLPRREDMTVDPISPYAISKHAAEQYCGAFYNLYGLETLVLRYLKLMK